MDIVNQEELRNMAKSWTTEQYLEVKESSYPM